ncbi:MAG: hypothetical protein GY773_02370 [Actinomycetia bacterium]|nr:hypothetical protein [Actinomycetes bacterium]
MPAPTPPPPPKPPKPRSFLGPLTLALLLLLTGGAAFADQVDWIDVDPAVFLGICLMVVGVVLVVSAFAGRARGLIFIGVLLLPVAWAVSTVDLTWWDGVGDEHYRVDSLDELEDEYRFGIGQLIVDLSDLDLEGQTQDVSVGLTIGEAIVYVPEGMHVDVDLDGRIGEMVVDLGITRYDDEGIDNSVDTEIGEPGNGTLNLDFDLGIGSGRVEVCSSTSEFGALLQCP